MKIKLTCAVLLLLLAAVGCITLNSGRATVVDNVISNPGVGFYGFTYHIPEDVELYSPTNSAVAEYSWIQQMALRIYDLNNEYHPRGNELFYESFLMVSDHTAFILVTLKHEITPSFDAFSSWSDLAPRWQVLPLYNVSNSRQTVIGERQLSAFFASGYAYENKGWYYSKPKSNRTKFCFEACKVMGANRDSYILMGFCLPGHEHLLTLKMQEMMKGFRF